MGHLTVRQEQVLACIREWIYEHREGPTVREIGDRVGLSSTSSGQYQLNRLEQHGVISR
ncbi:LexA family protein, partial [Streptomyces sp. NPDC055287]